MNRLIIQVNNVPPHGGSKKVWRAETDQQLSPFFPFFPFPFSFPSQWEEKSLFCVCLWLFLYKLDQVISRGVG